MKYLLVVFCLLLNLQLGCSDESERFEVIKKLRGIGAIATPSISESSSLDTTRTIALKFYIALPKDQSIVEIAPYIDSGSSQIFKATLGLNQESITTEDIGAINMVSFDATANVPVIPDALIDQLNGVAKIRYGVRVKTNSDEELIVGDYLVVKSGDASLEWKKPTLTLMSPTESNIQGSEYEIESSITKFQEETVKVTWFVTSGQLENPNSKKTKWTEITSGTHSLILIATGGRSKTSSILYKSISINP